MGLMWSFGPTGCGTSGRLEAATDEVAADRGQLGEIGMVALLVVGLVGDSTQTSGC